MVRAPLYSAAIATIPGRIGPLHAGTVLEYSKPHNAGAHFAGAVRGLGDRIGGDVDWLRAVPGGRGERRRRRLPRQALSHDQRTRLLPRPARRQGSDRLDLSQPRHKRLYPGLAGALGSLTPYLYRRWNPTSLADRQSA